MENELRTAIGRALEEAPERNFIQSLEYSITLKDIDLKNPKNRIQEEVRLPHGRGKEIKIAMFASGEMATKAKEAELDVIDPTTIEDLGGDKKAARKLAESYQYFLSEVPHMGTIGRYLGIVLGPRGKMPRPVPPVIEPKTMADNLRMTVVVRSRDKITFHTPFGTQKQSIDELTANGMAILSRVLGKLERGANNIRSIFIKTSMGPSVPLEVTA